jgi:two-component system cell cycle response regulator DivK
MYAVYLRFVGLEVDEATNGEDAVARALTRRPDVIVMDISMPTMDGCTAVSLLRADPRTASVPVIALTGYIGKDREQQARAAGCDAYLLKPCLPDALEAEIHRQLEHRRLERAS